MEEKKSNGLVVVVALLCLLVGGVGGYFISFSYLNKNEANNQSNTSNENNESSNKTEKEYEICSLDMQQKSDLSVECEETFAEAHAINKKIIIKNITFNGTTFELSHVVDYDESVKSRYYENSITKLYINGVLIDAYKATYRNILEKVSVKDGKLTIYETTPSEGPSVEHSYDWNSIIYTLGIK